MREQYRKAWLMARWLKNALTNAPTEAAKGEVWHSYERTCWMMNISYSLAMRTRNQLSTRDKQDTLWCKECYNSDAPMPISAVQVISGQRVGRSCNYWRCKECGTINRHVWVSGYPTRYELLKGFSK